jgi:hypothetical protein
LALSGDWENHPLRWFLGRIRPKMLAVDHGKSKVQLFGVYFKPDFENHYPCKFLCFLPMHTAEATLLAVLIALCGTEKKKERKDPVNHVC